MAAEQFLFWGRLSLGGGAKIFRDLTYFLLNIFNTHAGFLSSVQNFFSKFVQILYIKFFWGGAITPLTTVDHRAVVLQDHSTHAENQPVCG